MGGLLKRDPDFRDLPSIRLKEARYFLGIGTPRWLKRWESVFKYKIKHWETTKCVLLNLDSAITAFYPQLAKDPAGRALLANDFMFRMISIRGAKYQETMRLKREKKEREKQDNDDDEGGS